MYDNMLNSVVISVPNRNLDPSTRLVYVHSFTNNKCINPHKGRFMHLLFFHESFLND